MNSMRFLKKLKMLCANFTCVNTQPLIGNLKKGYYFVSDGPGSSS